MYLHESNTPVSNKRLLNTNTIKQSHRDTQRRSTNPDRLYINRIFREIPFQPSKTNAPMGVSPVKFIPQNTPLLCHLTVN